jgi:hypothetical protein
MHPFINFENRVQKAMWVCEIQFDLRLRKNVNEIWFFCEVFADDRIKTGTNVPKKINRPTIDRNESLNESGYILLAIARYETFIGECTPEISELLDIMIKIDHYDENRDYRNVQVLTPTEVLEFIENLEEKNLNGGKSKFSICIENLEKDGITLPLIYKALKNKNYSIKDFRNDIVGIDKVIRHVMV